jgi:hypothetical protein
MPTDSPVRDVMIEIVSAGNIGLPIVESAANVIAADAAFNIRMSAAHGRAGHSTATKLFERIQRYEDVVRRAQLAWQSYNSQRQADAGADARVILLSELRELKEALDALGTQD